MPLLPSQIHDAITVNDCDFSREGLWINYNLGEKEFDLQANPEQTCDLFKRLFWIEDYTGSGNDVSVKIEERPYPLTWSEFIMEQPGLSQHEFLQLATHIEKEKAYASLMNRADMGKAFSKLLKSAV